MGIADDIGRRLMIAARDETLTNLSLRTDAGREALDIFELEGRWDVIVEASISLKLPLEVVIMANLKLAGMEICRKIEIMLEAKLLEETRVEDPKKVELVKLRAMLQIRARTLSREIAFMKPDDIFNICPDKGKITDAMPGRDAATLNDQREIEVAQMIRDARSFIAKARAGERGSGAEGKKSPQFTPTQLRRKMI